VDTAALGRWLLGPGSLGLTGVLEATDLPSYPPLRSARNFTQ
jgi:hypothetical protein